MSAESSKLSERAVERRKHPRPDSSLRYSRFRREIEPPRALVAASVAFFSWIGVVNRTALAGAKGLRRLLSDLIDRQRSTRHPL